MIDLVPEYLNKIAFQIITISSLLSGFSIVVIANLLINKTENRVLNAILKTTIITASCFLVSVFAMTNIMMKTTEGYPFKVTAETLQLPKIIGFSTFIIGLIALSVLISLG